jgi:hypothetical protein
MNLIGLLSKLRLSREQFLNALVREINNQPEVIEAGWVFNQKAAEKQRYPTAFLTVTLNDGWVVMHTVSTFQIEVTRSQRKLMERELRQIWRKAGPEK